ncbi:unnamed protein product [Angiostrongylus costaricensis]|uniref:Tudor domain-containing protein n=1 Tax=Angiostrongylus costaricensis TaxID=334426 RepID=A0A158PDQ5_ANGCS|nr:unnamed protein product [Angiostrongylus costaricensis]
MNVLEKLVSVGDRSGRCDGINVCVAGFVPTLQFRSMTFASEYKVDFREGEELLEFYELNEDEAAVIVESVDEFLILHAHVNHEQKWVVVLNRVHIIEKRHQEEGTNEYRYERGLTVLACSRLGVRVLELECRSKLQCVYIAKKPIINGLCPSVVVHRHYVSSPRYLRQLSVQNGVLDFWSFTIFLSLRRSITLSDLSSCLRSDQFSDAYVKAGRIVELKRWYLIADVENHEYEVTMDVCVDGSALLILEDEVNGSPKMINIRFREVPTLFSLARCAVLKHFPSLRCDMYLTHLFSKRLFR